MKTIRNQNKSHFIILNLILSLLYLQLIEPFINNDLSVFAGDTQTSGNMLDLANENYYEGNFDKTIELVLQCLKIKGIDKETKIKAYTILVRTFISKENLDTAKEIIQRILKIDGNYQPTLEQEKPSLVNLVKEVRKENEKNQVKKYIPKKPIKSKNNTWLWIGAGGVVAAGVVVLLVAGGSSDPKEEQQKDLPAPPPFQ